VQSSQKNLVHSYHMIICECKYLIP